MHNPKISVIMTAYNSAKYIDGSVASILNQTMGDFELIIIDDASTDVTPEKIKDLAEKDKRITVISNREKIQPAISRNLGIRLARGEYIAILDSDDVSLPPRLESQSDYLDAHPECALVGCASQIIDEHNNVIGLKQPPADFYKLKFSLLTGNPIIHSGVMYRKAIAEKVGLYDNNYIHSEDYKLYSQLAHISSIATLPDLLIQYRHSPGAITRVTHTRRIQLDNARKISTENISHYIDCANYDVELLLDTFLGKNLNLSNFIKSVRLYNKIAATFILCEKLNYEQALIIKRMRSITRKKLLVSYFKTFLPFV